MVNDYTKIVRFRRMPSLSRNQRTNFLSLLFVRRSRLKTALFLLLCWGICHLAFLCFYDKGKEVVNRRNAWAAPTSSVEISAVISTKKQRDLNNRHRSLTKVRYSMPRLKVGLVYSNSMYRRFHFPPPRTLVKHSVTYNPSLGGLLLVLPYSSIRAIKTLKKPSDQQAVLTLAQFVNSMESFDGATCLQSLRDDGEIHTGKHNKNDAARNVTQESSWCRFARRNWSIQIRNTGPVGRVELPFMRKKTLHYFIEVQETVSFQTCNIIQGPVLIRSGVFRGLGGLRRRFGKLSLLEFFIRSRGQLKIAKLDNCAWSHEITRVDRGSLEQSRDFSEYASFGNKHNILRIVTENRIEWTSCIANWKQCPEKPYVSSQDLPSIALPICCSVVLGQILDDISWAMNKLGIAYRLVYGTLLGAVRSQAIIPWTYDIDIAIDQALFNDDSTFSELQRVLKGRYFVGISHMEVLRAHLLMAPYIGVDTVPFFKGPDDLQGDAFFSRDVDEAVQGMLPISTFWRDRCYVDFYEAPAVWMNDSSTVTINNKTFVTVKEVDYELRNWYGNYLDPSVQGKWEGLSDEGEAVDMTE